LALPADDQVAFPIADPAAQLDHGWAGVDQHRWLDEADRTLVHPPAAFAQRPSGAQPFGQRPAQPALPAVIQRLVDGLVAHMPARRVRVRQPQPGRDLLRAPVQLQLLLHHGAQRVIADQLPGPLAARVRPGARVGQVGVIDALVVRAHVPPQLPRDGRRRPAEPAGDLAYAMTAVAQRGDPLPFQPRQVPRGAGILGHPGGRDAASLGPPPVAGLPADPYLAARLNCPDAGEDQSPVRILEFQLPLATPSPQLHPFTSQGVLRQLLEPARRRGVSIHAPATVSLNHRSAITNMRVARAPMCA
jgi:hypothetical protein